MTPVRSAGAVQVTAMERADGVTESMLGIWGETMRIMSFPRFPSLWPLLEVVM